MKIIANLSKAFAFVVILPISLNAACSEKSVKWAPNGVVSVNGKSLRLDLQSVDTGLTVDGGVYLGGYRITKDRDNLPYVAFVPITLQEPKYWPFQNSVQQFFQTGGDVYVLQTDGKASVRSEEGWQQSELRFKPQSVVVAVDPKLIACNPAPLMKASRERGSCYAVDGTWDREISWEEVQPRICGEMLLAVEKRQGQWQVLKMNPETGEIVDSKSLAGPVKEPCSL